MKSAGSRSSHHSERTSSPVLEMSGIQPCPSCGVQIADPVLLLKHVQLYHPPTSDLLPMIPPPPVSTSSQVAYSCQMCERHFEDELLLARHLIDFHTIQSPPLPTAPPPPLPNDTAAIPRDEGTLRFGSVAQASGSPQGTSPGGTLRFGSVAQASGSPQGTSPGDTLRFGSVAQASGSPQGTSIGTGLAVQPPWSSEDVHGSSMLVEPQVCVGK